MSFAVIKRNHQGEAIFSYHAEVVARGEDWVRIRAPFQGRDRDLGYVYLRLGDIFTESFYTNRWYNVFRVEDAGTGTLKGWYCNITRPAEIRDHYVAADDLALDIFVKPNGETLLLDEDEFHELALPDSERASAWAAVDMIHQLVKARAEYFTDIVDDL